MTDDHLLRGRLEAAGIPVERVEPVDGGSVASAARIRRVDGPPLFAKALARDAPDVFVHEAEGLRALRELGGARTPEVVLASQDLLVLELLQPRRDVPALWEDLAVMVARVHSTVSDRFGWEHDGWLGRMRQDNTPTRDGHRFFAERRLLRWLDEPLVAAALDARDRRALERLCDRLPELVPVQPASLTHGDLWSGNVVATEDGRPVLVDPAVSWTWAEVDLAMLWWGGRPPVSDRFFGVYAEHAPLRDGWRERVPLLVLRELLSTIAHGDDHWGAADVVRRTVAPFRASASS